jgi:protein gp37
MENWGCGMRTKVTIRFLSVKPLLENLGALNLNGILWVIVGGKSGPKARPMSAEWVDIIQRQAEAAGAAFFFKQWGTWDVDDKKRGKKG